MFELVTFGGISLRGADGRQIRDVLRHPKQLALLAYLAVEARSVTRDELIGLFWPDVTEQSARQSLNRALSSLRGVLGAKAIVVEGSLARRLAHDIVRSDTAAFDAAFAAQMWSDVLDLYRGEFLRGFLLRNAREFEEWTSRTREAYRLRAVRAAEARAEELRAAGDLREAALVLADACEIAPERDDLAATVVEAFDDIGQPLAAIEWFARYERRLEEKLEEPPPPALAARVDQLRVTTRGPIRLVPSLTRLRPPRARWRYWPYAAVLATIGVAAALAGAIWLRVGDRTMTERRGLTTMVVRIVNRTPDVGWPHLAKSLEETLAARLSNPPRLYVASRTEHIDPRLATESSFDLEPRATREDVDFLVAGTVHQTAEHVRIDLQVSEGASRRAIRSLRVSRPLQDVAAVLDETAEELADTLRPVLGAAIASRMARTRATSTAAWNDLEHSKALLADGRRFAIRGASAQAAALLEIADSLARRATRADPQWIDPRLQLAHIDRSRGVLQLAGAMPDRLAATEHLAAAAEILVDAASRWPDDVRVHELAGTVAYERWFVARERDTVKHFLDAAVQSLEHAILLDPYAARPWVALSDVHAALGDHVASIVAAQRALERDAFAEHSAELHNRLFYAYFELHEDEDAARWCDEINRRGPGRALGVLCELTLQGWSSVREPNLAVADSLIENLDVGSSTFATMMWPRLRMLHAAVAARVGERLTARRLLDDAVAESRRAGDAEAAYFHAAALVRLGDFDAARRVLADRPSAVGEHVVVERWFHALSGTDVVER